jgi:hypothetical protein
MIMNRRRWLWTKDNHHEQKDNDWTEYDQEQKTMATNRKKTKGPTNEFTHRRQRKQRVEFRSHYCNIITQNTWRPWTQDDRHQKEKNDKGVSGELVPPKKYGKGGNLGFCSCYYNVASLPWKKKKKGEQWDHRKGDELTILHSHVHLHTKH